MSTLWTHYCHAITTDKVIGDQVGVILDPDPNATESFTTPLRLIGAEGSATAWFSAVPLTAFGVSIISEFLSNGPYPQCNSIGIDDVLLRAGKAVITLSYGLRTEIEGTGQTYITEQGYEIIPTE